MGGFADRMKQYMDEKGWNQPEFAQFLGVTKQDINGWISGKHTPYIKRLDAIAEKMGVSVNWLLGHNDARDTGQALSNKKKYLMDRIAKADDRKIAKIEKLMEIIDDEEGRIY